MSLSTPVVFLIFNRPDLTEIVFKAISQARPKKLLIIADGPRFSEEVGKCEEARSIIDKVDWDCELLTNLSDINLGCKKRVSSGLDWAFGLVEEAIILEDDCLPTLSFFNFCQTLLEYYRFDERIMHISGDNFQFGESRTPYSYYFSKYAHCWGWASWRRAWKYYDKDMKTWPRLKELKILDTIYDDPYEQRYWTDIFDRTHEGNIDTWAYQWIFACWIQSGLSILPNLNLVSNIGFHGDATHTKGSSRFANMPTEAMKVPLRYPEFVIRDAKADHFTQRTHFDNAGKLSRVKSKVRALLKRGKNEVQDLFFRV